MPSKSERGPSGAPDRRQPASSPQDTPYDESSLASRSGAGRARSGTVRRTEDNNDDVRPRRERQRRKVESRDDQSAQAEDYQNRGKDTGSKKDPDRSGYEPYMLMTGDQAHLPDQFPGQVPQEYSLPYRPQPTTRTDSYGQASEYYGDEGQSVQYQPGVRPGTPIVVGAEPHLLAASATAVPAQDTGNGAAAEFYGNSTTAVQSTMSAPYDTRPPPNAGAQSGALQRPAPHSSQSDPAPSYTVPLAIGTAGFVAAEMMDHEHKVEKHSDAARPQSASDRPRPYGPTTVGPSSNLGTAQPQRPQHNHHHSPRRRGTLGRFVDWWNDHEGVEKMEKYTQYIGVCRDCFDPHTSAVDAPRRHHYRRRVNAEHRHRVDKDSRYSSSSSDSETSRRRHSTKRRHSPRLERRSSNRMSSSSYGVVETDRRPTGTEHFEENSRNGTSSRAEHDHTSSYNDADALQRREPSYEEFRRANQTQTEHKPGRRDQGFFSSFFSPSSNSRRRDRAHQGEAIKVDLEADTYGSSRYSKRKRGQDSHVITTANATEALIGLGAATAALAAAGGRGNHAAPYSQSSRSYHNTVERHHRSRSEDSWESASVSDDSSSIHSALAFGDYEVEPPRKRRASQGSVSSQSSEAGKWDRRRHERRSTRKTRPDEGHPEVLFDREDYHQDSWNDRTDFQESRQRPLQTLDPRPMSPSSETGLHNHERDIRLYQPQPVSPPKVFSRFETAEHGRRPQIHHAQSAPTPLAYTPRNTYANERWQESLNISEKVIPEASSSRNARETDHARKGTSQLNERTRDAVTTVPASALVGAAIGAFAKNSLRKERKASVRFAGMDSEGEDVTTAQHHSQSERHESISSVPTTSKTTWHGNEPTHDTFSESSTVLANHAQNYANPTFKDFSADDHRDYHEPILDDDIDDRDFFKRSSSTNDKSQQSSADNHHENGPDDYEEPLLSEKQEKEADDYITSLEKRYSPESFSVSQADFFRPELGKTVSGKVNVLDRRADDYNDDSVQHDDNNDRPSFARQSSVPTLRIIAATPPPELVKQRKQGAGSSRLQYSESQDSPKADVIRGVEAESEESGNASSDRPDDQSREHRRSPLATMEDYQEEEDVQATESRRSSTFNHGPRGDTRTDDEFREDVTSNVYANETLEEEIERKTPGGFIEEEQGAIEDLRGSEVTTSNSVSSPAGSRIEDWEPSPKVDIEMYPVVKAPQSYAALPRFMPPFVRHQFPGIEESVYPMVSATSGMLEDLPDLVQQPRIQHSTPSHIVAVPYSPPLAHQTRQESMSSPSSQSFGLTSPRDDPRRLSANLAFQEHSDAIPELTPLPESRPNSPYSDTVESPLASPRHQDLTPLRRHSHTSTPSTTAIPLRFLRHAQSPSWSRSSPFDIGSATPSSPIAAPQSPNTPARPKPRPSSGEFKTWHEYRPLYLVERNAKSHDSDELLETLPSLPSSTTGSMLGSRTSSIRDGGEGEDHFVSATQSPADSLLADEPGDGYLEQANYFDRFDDTSNEDVKYLGSQQATPKALAVDAMGRDDEIPDLSIADETVLHHEISVRHADTLTSPTRVDDDDNLPFETPVEKSTASGAVYERETSPTAVTLADEEDVASSGNKLPPQRPSLLGRGLAAAAAATAATAAAVVAADVVKKAVSARIDETVESDERGLDGSDVEPQTTHTGEQDEELWPVKALSKKDKKRARQKGGKVVEDPIVTPVLAHFTMDDVETVTDQGALPASPSLEPRDLKAESPEPVDEPADWSITSTSKKDKRKGKKSKGLLVTTSSAARKESESTLPEPAPPADFTKLSNTPIEDVTQPTLPSLSTSDVHEADPIEPESFWEGTFSSKKDKKKAKKQAKTQSRLSVAAPAEIEESTVEPQSPAVSAELSRTLIDDTVDPIPASPGAQDILEPETEEPESFWEGAFTSKKDKKKAKKQAKQATQAKLPQSPRVVDKTPHLDEPESEEVTARATGVFDKPIPQSIPLPAVDDADLEPNMKQEVMSKADLSRVKQKGSNYLTKHGPDDADAPNMSPQAIPLPTSDIDETIALALAPQDVPLPIACPEETTLLAGPAPHNIPLPASESDEVMSLAEMLPSDISLPVLDADEAVSLAGPNLLEEEEHDFRSSTRSPTARNHVLDNQHEIADLQYEHDSADECPTAPRHPELAPELIVLPEVDNFETTALTSSPAEPDPSARSQADPEPPGRAVPEDIVLPAAEEDELQAISDSTKVNDELLVGSSSSEGHLNTTFALRQAMKTAPDVPNITENASSPDIDDVQVQASEKEPSQSSVARDVALPEIDNHEVQALREEVLLLNNAENVALPEVDDTEVQALAEERSQDLNAEAEPALPQEMKTPEYDRPVSSQNELNASQVLSSELPLSDRAKDDSMSSRNTHLESDTTPVSKTMEPAEDDWAFPVTTKKGKKGKKARKAGLATEDETASAGPSVKDSFSSLDKEVYGEAAPRGVKVADPTDPTQSQLSKTGTGSLAAQLLSSEPNEANDTTGAAQASTFEAGTSRQLDEHEGNASSIPEAAVKPFEDEWAYPISTKKSKKGKKAKKGWENIEESMQPQLPSDGLVMQDSLTPWADIKSSAPQATVSQVNKATTMDESSLVPAMDDSISRWADGQHGIVPISKEAAVDPAEDEWAFPISSKKSKKGKKGKKAWEETEATTQSQVPFDALIAQVHSASRASVEQTNTYESNMLDEPSLAPEIPDEILDQSLELSTPAAKDGSPAEDDWDFPMTTKKGKKGKRSRKAAQIEEELPTQDQAPDAAEQARDAVVDKADIEALLPPIDNPESLQHITHPEVNTASSGRQQDGLDKVESTSFDAKAETTKLDPVADGRTSPATERKGEHATGPAFIEKELAKGAHSTAVPDYAHVPIFQPDDKVAKSALVDDDSRLQHSVASRPFADDLSRLQDVAERGELSNSAESSIVQKDDQQESHSVLATPAADTPNTDPTEDEWAFPVTVKSKKGRKEKLKTPSFAAESGTVEQEDLDQSKSVPPTPNPGLVEVGPSADEWAFPVDVKKSKKGKKDKFNAANDYEAQVDPGISKSMPANTAPDALTRLQAAGDEEFRDDQWLSLAKKGQKSKKSKGRGTPFTWLPEVEGKDKPAPAPKVDEKDEPTPTHLRDGEPSGAFAVPGAFLPESPSATVTTATGDLVDSQKIDTRTGSPARTYAEDDHQGSFETLNVSERIGTDTRDEVGASSKDKVTSSVESRNITDHAAMQQLPPEEIALPSSPPSSVRHDFADESPHYIDAEHDRVSVRDMITSPSQYLGGARRLGGDFEHNNMQNITQDDPKQTREDKKTTTLANQQLQALHPDVLRDVGGEEAQVLDSIKTPDWDPNYITQWAMIANTVTTNKPDQGLSHDKPEALPGPLSAREEPEDRSKQLKVEQEATQIESESKKGVWKGMPPEMSSTPVMMNQQEADTFSSSTGQESLAPSNFAQNVVEEEPEPWAFTLKSKKGKKGKKDRAVAKPAETRHATRDEGDAALIAAEAGELRPDTADSVSLDREGVSETAPTDAQETPGASTLVPDVEDEEPGPWAFTVKSKKGKKGKKNQAVEEVRTPRYDQQDKEVSALLAAEAGELRPDAAVGDANDGTAFPAAEASKSLHTPQVGEGDTLEFAGKRGRLPVQEEQIARRVPAVGEFGIIVESPAPIEDSTGHATTHEQKSPTRIQAQDGLEDYELNQSFSSMNRKNAKGKDNKADMLPPVLDEQYSQPMLSFEDPQPLPISSADTPAETAPDDDFWGSSFKPQKKSKKGKRGKVFDSTVNSDIREQPDIVVHELQGNTKETEVEPLSNLLPSAVESDSTKALDTPQAPLPNNDKQFDFYSQSNKKKKGKNDRGRTSDFMTMPSEPTRPATDDRQLSYDTLAGPEKPIAKFSWADEMEALDAAEQGSTVMNQPQHQDSGSRGLSSRLDTDAGDMLDKAEDNIMGRNSESLETVEAGLYGLSESVSQHHASAPGMNLKAQHSIDEAETLAVSDVPVETVNRSGAVRDDNNTTTRTNPNVMSASQTADVDNTATRSTEVAEPEPPVILPLPKMSKKDRKKAEKARRKEEEGYMGEDWWIGSTPAEPPVKPSVEPTRSAEQFYRYDLRTGDAYEVEGQAPDLQHKDRSVAHGARVAHMSDQTSAFDAALAATLDNAGFDPTLVPLEPKHEQHEQQATAFALDEDENAAARRAESVERRRSRRSSSQSLRSAAQETEGDERDRRERNVAGSFEQVVASTLAMAGFDAGHFGEQRQTAVREGANEEKEADETNEATTATRHMWNTGAKILGLLGAGTVVDKTVENESDPAIHDDEREGVRTGTEEVEKGHVRKSEDGPVGFQMPIEPVASGNAASETIQPRSPNETGHRSPIAYDKPLAFMNRQRDNYSITAHEEPKPTTSWSFDNNQSAHEQPQSPTDIARTRLSAIPELEQAQKDNQVEVQEQPFSAQATAARIFSNPRSPQTSFAASMRTSQGDAVQSLHVHRQRISSGAGPGPETANTRRQAVRQERRDISPGEYLSPYHSPTASNVSYGSVLRSITPILRRTDRKLSGDLRALSRGSRDDEATSSELKPKSVGSLTTSADVDKIYDPLRGSGSGRMSEVSQQQQQQQHEEWRDMRGSSPRAPPSLYRKQSRQILELESHIAQLSAENQTLQQQSQFRSRSRADDHDWTSALQAKDVEISQLRAKLSVLREDTARLHEHNSQLQAANRNLSADTNERYATLQAEHADVHEQLRQTEADLASLRDTHARVSEGIGAAVEQQIAAALSSKDSEIAGLKAELAHKETELDALHAQLLALQNERENEGGSGREGETYLHPRTIDYFDSACHQLFTHLSSWILRFSKFSDSRSCVPTSSLSSSNANDKLLARLDTALLDGSDVDSLLADRVRRRDVFMAVAVGMLWEYIFTRYLFGLERSQRQRLKTLERTLSEVGPARTVANWRATTLTLLSRLPSFEVQRTLDADAVVAEILGSLSSLLPPPRELVGGLRESLEKIVNLAVGLSVEMRCQKPEYIMLPPLHPEFDRDGELVRTVRFNPSLMTARDATRDAEEGSVVQLVLFPLVVRKGDEAGAGDEEIVVSPAQVVLAPSTSHLSLGRQSARDDPYMESAQGPPRKIVRVLSSGVVMDGQRAVTGGWGDGGDAGGDDEGEGERSVLSMVE